jgi:DNA-binding response OmpR family regulator
MTKTKEKKVLIVEDDAFLNKYYEARFNEEGIKTIMLTRGEQAFEITKKEKPNLVILDVGLPDTNGFDIAKKIKSNKDTKKIPVFLLTKLAQKHDIAEGKKVGADEYIIKMEQNLDYVIDKSKKIFK